MVARKTIPLLGAVVFDAAAFDEDVVHAAMHAAIAQWVLGRVDGGWSMEIGADHDAILRVKVPRHLLSWQYAWLNPENGLIEWYAAEFDWDMLQMTIEELAPNDQGWSMVLAPLEQAYAALWSWASINLDGHILTITAKVVGECSPPDDY